RPAELVQLYESGPRSGGEADWVAMPNFRDWRAATHVFRDMAAYRYALLTLSGREGPESMLGVEATDRLFAVLGTPPLLGRIFGPGEDAPGRAGVTVLSHALWQKRYGADPAIVGRSVTVDGVGYTVVGVMPPSFRFPSTIPGDTVAPIDLWIP